MSDVSRDRLLFSVGLSIRYHDRRQRFYQAFSSLSHFVATLAASSGAATIQSEFASPGTLAIIGLVLSALFAWTLVVGPEAKVGQQADLRRRFIDLERRLRTSHETPELVSSCVAERLSIEADAPPALRVLATICHNEQSRAMGYGPGDMIRVGFWQRRFAPFFDVAEHRLHKEETAT